MKTRIKCRHCGHVQNLEGNVCSKCSEQIGDFNEGRLFIYRMGSPLGVAVGYGIYINNQPYGHLGNKELLEIPLKFGTYTIHCTAGMTRRCEDLTFCLSPENPIVYAKASIKAGFWSNTIKIVESTKEEMPLD